MNLYQLEQEKTGKKNGRCYMVAKRANWQVHRKCVLWHFLELSLRNLRRNKDSFAFYLIENEIYTPSLTSQDLQNLTCTALTSLSASHTTFFVPRTFHSHCPSLHFLNTLSLFIPRGLKLSIYVPGMLFWLSSWHLCLISNVMSTERPKLDTLSKVPPFLLSHSEVNLLYFQVLFYYINIF